MTTDSSISVGIFDGFSWIRCEGKGSFLNSPTLKEFGDERIAGGERCLVVDLEGCTGMDSTFMGTLAGMAARLTAQDEAVLQVAEPGARNRRSLEDLGLDFMMEIDPPEAPWRGKTDQVRTRLEAPRKVVPGQLQRTIHVLEAHQTLADANDKNARTFSNVVTMLESELAEKQKLAETGDK
ncbi:MAG: anti-sigma factor antagonist [Verrucomicrobiaceae bacterium]|nr:MAG: anti-sigma factor antagonist [Verrucomicrobiaceae bacterium]